MVAGVGSRHNNVVGRRGRGRSTFGGGVRRLENTPAPKGRAAKDSDGGRGRGRNASEGRPTGEPMTGEQADSGGAPCVPVQAALG